MKNKSFLIALTILALFALSFLFLKRDYNHEASEPSPASGKARAQFSVVPASQDLLVKPHAISKGPFAAKVTMVEFLDPECESCAAMAPIVKKIADEFSADLRVVVRYMPFHQNSKLVANILEGAREENKFWQALEILFANQERWANHNKPNPDLIPEILEPLKLNMDKIMKEAKSGKYDQQIGQDLADGKALGVRGTPTFFVNGHMVPELGYEALRAAVQAQIQKSN